MRIERIDTEAMTLAIGLPDTGAPILVYLGAPLPADQDLSVLAGLSRAPHWGGLPDAPVGPSFLPVAGAGFMGAPGLSVSGSSGPIVMVWRYDGVTHSKARTVVGLTDPESGLEAALLLSPLPGGGLSARLSLGADAAKEGVRLDALGFTLPLPSWAQEVATFAGRWAGEWRQQRENIAVGQRINEARGGRPGFSAPGCVILCASQTSQDHGPALALHLLEGHEPRVLVEGFAEGGGQVQLSRRDNAVAPDSLSNGGAHTPPLEMRFSDKGFNGLRAQARGPQPPANLKVHLNSWEALYFDYDEARLLSLVDAAAELGAERFVLDDGWFKGRRNDRAGLGDWTPDPERFPHGLMPLIARVQECGMEFGLWIEPEMVNPDSDLYRAHPDWALQEPLMRSQLALNLEKQEVVNFVYETVDRLLSDYPIAYLKWDHNRALLALASYDAVAHQAALLQHSLKSKHPHVVFESCASGGARLHRGQLSWADRFWLSDNTDAHARVPMIEALSQFLPLSTLGAHVGASPNPITGRRSDMAFRAKIAMFGHMGVEADPAKMTDAERVVLKAHIALYRRFRHLVDTGVFSVGGQPDPGVRLWQLTAPDRAEALALIFRCDEAAKPFAPATPLRGLDPQTNYRLTLLEPWPKPAAGLMRNADLWRDRPVLCGSVLMQHGLSLPLVHPETAWLVHVEAVP